MAALQLLGQVGHYGVLQARWGGRELIAGVAERGRCHSAAVGTSHRASYLANCSFVLTDQSAVVASNLGLRACPPPCRLHEALNPNLNPLGIALGVPFIGYVFHPSQLLAARWR